MPLISPPPNDETPKEPAEPIQVDEERIRRFLDVANWKCSHCGCVVFGRTKECPYCKFRLGGIISKRPEGFIE